MSREQKQKLLNMIDTYSQLHEQMALLFGQDDQRFRRAQKAAGDAYLQLMLFINSL